SGCGAISGPPSARSPLTEIDYDVRVVSTTPWVLEIGARFVGGVESIFAEHPEGLISIEHDGSALDGAQGRFVLACKSTCTVRYRIDLTRVAADNADSFEAAVRSGPDIVGPGSSWLLRPTPVIPNLPVRIAVDLPEGVNFATGLHRSRVA